MPDPASLPYVPKPQLVSVTSTFFQNLLNRLGVKPPPTEGFDLITTVQPITIVDQDVPLAVFSSTILCDLPFTTGVQIAPAANTVLADTGQQPFGNYNVNIYFSVADPAASNRFQIARRNAANLADIWSQDFSVFLTAGTAGSWGNVQMRLVLQANERIVVRNVGAGGAGSQYQASIWLAAG